MTRAKTGLAVTASAVIVAILTLAVVPLLAQVTETPDSPLWLGEALWQERVLDLIVQALILLAASLAVVMLLRPEPGEGTR